MVEDPTNLLPPNWSTIMLLVGGGIVPQFYGTAAGIIGALINRNATEQGDDMTKTSIVFGTKE